MHKIQDIKILEGFQAQTIKMKLSGTINSANSADKIILVYDRTTSLLIASALADRTTGDWFCYAPYREDETLTVICRDEGGDFNADIYDRLSLCTEENAQTIDYHSMIISDDKLISETSEARTDRLISSMQSNMYPHNLADEITKLTLNENGKHVFKNSLDEIIDHSEYIGRGCIINEQTNIIDDNLKLSRVFDGNTVSDIFSDGSDFLTMDFSNGEVKDLSGNHYSLNGKKQFKSVLSRDGYGVKKDTIGDLLETGVSLTDGEYSFSFWLNLDTYYHTSYDGRILYQLNGMHIAIKNNGYLYIGSGNGSGWNTLHSYLLSPTNYFQRRWVHIVATFSKTETKVYIDNELKVTFADIGITVPDVGVSGYPLLIDNNYGSYGIYYSLDGLRIFNKEISITEVDILYNEKSTQIDIDSIYAHKINDGDLILSGINRRYWVDKKNAHYDLALNWSDIYGDKNGVVSGIETNGEYIAFDGTNSLHELVSSTDESAGSVIDESNIDIYCRFNADELVGNQVIWKSGGSVDGIAIGIKDSNAGVFGMSTSVATSIEVSGAAAGNWYRLLYKNNEIVLFNDNGMINNRLSGEVIAGNGTNQQSIAGADASSPMTAASSGSLDYFTGSISDVVIYESGNSVVKTINQLKLAAEIGTSGVECQVEVEEWDAFNNQCTIWLNIPEISSTEDTIIHFFFKNDNDDNVNVSLIESTPTLPGDASADETSLWNLATTDALIYYEANISGLELDPNKLSMVLDSSQITEDQIDFPLTIHLGEDEKHDAIFTELSTRTITAKSIILDIFDNWGDGGILGIRSIEFYLDGSLISMTSGFTAYSTSVLYDETPDRAFNTSLSKIGSYVGNNWMASPANQRLIIVFDTVLEFDKIVINNGHHVGTETDWGMKNVIITASDDEITSTVYNDTITNAAVLFDGIITEHPATDTIDDKDYYQAPIKNKKLSIEANDVQCPIEIENWKTVTNEANYPPSQSSTYVLATTSYSQNFSYQATDPALSLIGTRAYTSWLSDSGTGVDQKLNIDLGDSVIINGIYLENGHHSGTLTEYGIKNFILYGTNEPTAFANTTYATLTDLVEIASLQATEHSAVDESDPQYFTFSNNIPYRYYILRLADNWGGETRQNIRHIELLHSHNTATIHTKVPVYSASEDTELIMSFDKDAEDNPLIGESGSSAAQNVWDNNFVVVYHMNQDPSISNILDSTSNANQAIPSGTMTSDDSVDGFYGGKAIDFDGVDDALTSVSNIGIVGSSQRTVELQGDIANAANNSLFWWGTDSPNDRFSLDSTNNTGFFVGVSTANRYWNDDISGLSYTAIVLPSGVSNTSDLIAYVNGGLASVESTVPGEIITEDSTLEIGKGNSLFGSHTNYEFRVSDIERSANWIKLTNLSLTNQLITYEDVYAGQDVPEGPTSITAKSVVIDIAENYGDVSYMGMRSIEFFMDDVLIPMTSGFIVYATTVHSDTYGADNVFDTGLSKTGVLEQNEWLSGNGDTTSQRLIIVFDTPVEFDKIVVNNSHTSGTTTFRGVQNVVITASDDAITSTVYNDTITTPTVIFDGVIAEHIASDVEDPQIVWEFPVAQFDPSIIPDNKKIKLTLDSSQISTDQAYFPLTVHLDTTDPLHAEIFTELGTNSKKISIEADDIQCPVEIESWETDKATLHTKVPNYSSSTDTELVLSWDINQGDNNEYVGLAGEIGQDCFPATLTEYDSYSTGRTYRLKIGKNNLEATTSHFRLKLGRPTENSPLVSECWIGNASSSGNPWDFDGGQKQVFFDGGNSNTTVTVDSQLSDLIDFDIDGLSDIVISFSTTGGQTHYVSAPVGGSTYYINNTAIVGDTAPAGLSSDTNWRLVSGLVSQTPAQNVWDGNFVFVSHQAQDPSGTAPQILDSTSYAKHGTSYGSMTSGDLIDGATGKMIEYDGVDDYTNHGYDSAHDITNTLTIEASIKPSILLDSGTTAYSFIVGRQGDPTPSSDTYAFSITSDGNLMNASQGGQIKSTKASWAADQNFIVAATYTATGLSGDLFIDGAIETLSDDSYDTMTGSSNNLIIGSHLSAVHPFPGSIGEVRISATVRSADWIKLTNLSLTNQLVSYSSLSDAPVETGIIAKSVILDISDNWGADFYISMMSLEFLLDGSVIPMTSGFTAYSTSNWVDYEADQLFDTSLSKTGPLAGNGWMSGSSAINQRLIIVFDTPLKFDKIVVNNGHDAEYSFDRGAKNVVVTASDDAITSTVFEDTITNATVLFDGVIAEHVNTDTIDDQTVYEYVVAFTPSLVPDSNKLTITLDSSQISTNQTDFPLTIQLNDTDALHAMIFTELVPQPVAAKSVILDIADNWGDADHVGIRSIEFWLNGSMVPMTSGFTAYATTNYSSTDPLDVFDTSLSKIGSYAGTAWMSVSSNVADQRLIIVFDTAIEFDKIVINNHHYIGGETTRGAKNVVITASADSITSTVYNDTITNPTALFSDEFTAHSALNVADDQTYFDAIPSTHKLSVEQGTTQLPVEIESWRGGIETAISEVYNSFDQSSYYTTWDASLIFDSRIAVTYYWLNNTGETLPHWVSWGYSNPVSRPITSYTIQANSVPESARMPKDWVFQGSTNNTTWVTLDTVTGETSWGNSETRSFTCDDISTAYQYYRIYITDNNGDAYTQLAYVVLFNTSPMKATLHTKVPTYSSSVDTALTLSWDINQEDNDEYVGEIGEAAAQDVWDDNFVFVSHQAQDPSGTAPQILDSTSNNNDGTSYGDMTSDDLIDGSTGKMIEYDGVDDYTSHSSFNSGAGYADFTAEVVLWTPEDYSSSVAYILSKDGAGENVGDGCLRVTENNIFEWHNDSSIGDVTGGSLTLGNNDYLVYTSSAGSQELFQNASLVDTSTDTITIWNTNVDLEIGAVLAGSYLFPGAIGEVRISNIVRSADWIKLTNQSLTDQLITWSVPEIVEEGHFLDGWENSDSVIVTIPSASVNSDISDFKIPLYLKNDSGTNSYDFATFFTNMMLGSYVDGTNISKYELGANREKFGGFYIDSLIFGEDASRNENASMKFGAAENVITLPNSIRYIVGADKMSISFWINPSNKVDVTQSIFGSTYFNEIAVYIGTSNNLVFHCGYHTSYYNTISTAANSIKSGQWTHVIYTRDYTNSIQKIYLNGEHVASTSMSRRIDNGSLPITIGYNEHQKNYFDGFLSQFIIFEDELTSEEVIDIYNDPFVSSYKNKYNTTVFESTNTEFQFLIGDTVNSIDMTNSTGSTNVFAALTNDDNTYFIYDSAWRNIASKDESIHGNAGDSDWHYRDSADTWTKFKTGKHFAISKASEYVENRMTSSILRNLTSTEFDLVFDDSTGIFNIATILKNESDFSEGISSINFNDKNYWGSNIYDLNDYNGLFTSSIIEWSYKGFEKHFKVFVIKTGDTSWTECTENGGTVPGLTEGLDTIGMKLQFKVEFDILEDFDHENINLKFELV